MELSARRELARQWVAVTALAWMAGVLLAGALWRWNAEEVSEALGGILIGVLLGMLQWLVLRTHLRISPWWPVVTAAVLGPLSWGVAQFWPGGLIFPYMPGGLLFPYMPLQDLTDWWPQAIFLPLWVRLWVLGPVVGLIWGSVTGALLGAAQWLLLWRRRPGAGRWVVANVVGLGAGFAAGAVALACFALALKPIRLSDAAAVWVLMAAVGVRGAVSGAITARMLPPATLVEQEELGGATMLGARRELVQQWVVVTALGWATGGLLAGILGMDTEGATIAVALWGVLSGAALGVLQWLVLRPHLRASLWWVAVTAVVLGLLAYGAAQVWQGLTYPYMMDWGPTSSFTTISYLLAGVAAAIAGLVVLASVTGAILGAAQWLVLRRQRLEAGRWVVANIVGQGAGLAAGAVILSCLMLAFESIDLPSSTIIPGVVISFFMAAMGVGGAVSGAITARALPLATLEPEEPREATPLHTRRDLAQEWVVVTALGWAAIGLLAGILYSQYDRAAIMALGSISGAVLGLLQWLVLRAHLRISLWWAAVTAAVLGLLSYGLSYVWPKGLIFPYVPAQNFSAAHFYLQLWVALPIQGFVLGSVTGALLGAAQWLLLGRQRPDALRWMAANVVGLGVGFAASTVVFACLAAVQENLHSDIAPGVAVLFIVALPGLRGAASGAITARVLPPATVMEVEEPGEATPLPARRGLAWQWVAATALAWMAGGLLVGVLWRPSPDDGIAALVLWDLWGPSPDDWRTALVLGGILSGAALGVLQWRVLRPHLRISLWWAAVTAAVIGLLSYGAAQIWRGGLPFPYMPARMYPLENAIFPGFGLQRWLAGPVVELVLGSVTGVLLGAVQWLLLGRQHPGSGRWVVANAVGLGTGFAAGTVALTCFALALRSNISSGAAALAFMAGAGVRGAVSGAITARTLLRLL